MKTFSKALLIVFLLGIAFGGILLAGRAQNGPPKSGQESLRKEQPKLRDVPVVDFNQNEADPIRRRRSSRHDSPVTKDGNKRPTLNDSMEPFLFDLPLSDQPAEPALPVASNLVITGTITAARAYLSSDKTGIYTELTVEIEDVLKAGAEFGLSSHGVLTAEREGGAVRFVSGKVVRRGKLGRNIPTPGGRYLLFLNATSEPDVFSIVTGYEIANDRVIPLDSAQGFSQFSGYECYRNVTQSSLFDAVKEALSRMAKSDGDRL